MLRYMMRRVVGALAVAGAFLVIRSCMGATSVVPTGHASLRPAATSCYGTYRLDPTTGRCIK